MLCAKSAPDLNFTSEKTLKSMILSSKYRFRAFFTQGSSGMLFWTHFWATWAKFGTSWITFGRFWVLFCPSCALLGASWALLTVFFAHFFDFVFYIDFLSFFLILEGSWEGFGRPKRLQNWDFWCFSAYSLRGRNFSTFLAKIDSEKHVDFWLDFQLSFLYSGTDFALELELETQKIVIFPRENAYFHKTLYFRVRF